MFPAPLPLSHTRGRYLDGGLDVLPVPTWALAGWAPAGAGAEGGPTSWLQRDFRPNLHGLAQGIPEPEAPHQSLQRPQKTRPRRAWMSLQDAGLSHGLPVTRPWALTGFG